MLFESMLLYDQSLYFLRQEYFRCRDLDWKELPIYPSWFELCMSVKETEAWTESKLDINVKKQTIKSTLTVWKSWIKSKNDYKINPEKYKSEPKIPRYKYRHTNWYKVTIDRTRFRGKDEHKIVIPCTKLELDVPSNLKKEWITEIVLTKKSGRIHTSFVYDVRKKNSYQEQLKKLRELNGLIESRFLSIDLGKVNILTAMTYNCGKDDTSFLIRGHHFNNKINDTVNKISFLQEEAMRARNKEVTLISKKDGLLKLYKNTNQMCRIWSSYNNFIDNQIGNISNMIIDCCLEKRIGTIVVGYDEGWKQYVEMGKQNNKVFCHIPHRRLMNTIRMKAELLGIKVIVVEESYTSKCDHFALEEMCHHDKYLGKRKSRGKFVSSTGRIIHADVNGCIGMIRKANVIPDAVFIDGLRNRGDVVSPVVLNVRGFTPHKQQSSENHKHTTQSRLSDL